MGGNMPMSEYSEANIGDYKDTSTQLLSEYVALRSEILHRMGIRHQIVSFSVIVLAAIWALDAKLNTFLAYPFLGFFLALGWAHNDFRIGEIGEYIRKHIESKLPGLYWEQHFYDLNRKNKPLRFVFRANILSAGGMIVGTQVLSIIVFLIGKKSSEINIFLLVVDCVTIVLTCLVLCWRKVIYENNDDIIKTKRPVLFIPNSELRKYFKENSRQDVKIVTASFMSEVLAEKLRLSGKEIKTEELLKGARWVHSTENEANKICNALDFLGEYEIFSKAGPVAISFANKGSVETFHSHDKHCEIYYSDHKICATYRLPGIEQILFESMDEGGAIVFSQGIEHCIEVNGLTIVLEVPAVEGDKKTR